MSGKEHDDGLDASFIISQAKSRNRPLHPYTPEKEEEASALSEPSGVAMFLMLSLNTTNLSMECLLLYGLIPTRLKLSGMVFGMPRMMSNNG